MSMKSPASIVAVVLAVFVLESSATVVLTDSFDIASGIFQEFDLQSNQAARQAGGSLCWSSSCIVVGK